MSQPRSTQRYEPAVCDATTSCFSPLYLVLADHFEALEHGFARARCG